MTYFYSGILGFIRQNEKKIKEALQFVILASKKNDENQKRKKKMEHNVKTNI